MNPIKMLMIEYDGISKTINSFDDECSAANMLPQLKKALDLKDKETIIYCLEVIEKWYADNMIQIERNIYVNNQQEHYRCRKIITKIKDELKEYTFEWENSSMDDQKTYILNQKDKPLIFLSHKSIDKKYGDALRNFIVGLGVKEEQLIYTSHELHKIPLGRNIYDYLRENITNKVFMIILWSNDYIESPACLNEMGAAWVVQSDYTNIYVPTFSFGNPKYRECAVDTNKMGAVLNGDGHCKTSMIELKNQIEKMFGLQNDEKKTMYILDKFIEEISDDGIISF